MIIPLEKSERFWKAVQKTSHCWLWTKARDPNGYGRCAGPPWTKNSGTWLAHRLAWLLTNGEIPPGIHVLHHCDNPPCVRPTHLYLGTDKDNHRDARERGRLALKLSFEQVKEIRHKYATTQATQRSLAKEYGVTQAHIWFLVNNRQRISS